MPDNNVNEQAVMQAINDLAAAQPYGVSFRDVSAVTGLGVGTCHRICRRLREAGAITFTDHVARSIQVV